MFIITADRWNFSTKFFLKDHLLPGQFTGISMDSSAGSFLLFRGGFGIRMITLPST